MNESAKCRTVFFGSIPTAGECLKQLIDHPQFEVLGVVTRSNYQCDWAPGKRNVADVAKCAGIALLELADLRDLKPDWGLSVRFHQIFSGETIQAFAEGLVNFHGGPLPYYRGAACANWAILDGREEFGITAHFIDPGIDTGDIVKCVMWPVNASETVADVFFRSLQEITKLFGWVLSEIAEKGDLPRIRQDEVSDRPWPIRSTKAQDMVPLKRLDPAALTENPQQALNVIRAFDFPNRPPAYIEMAGQRIEARLCRPVRNLQTPERS